VALRDLLDQAQTQAHAAGLLGMAGQAEKSFENSLSHRFGYARATVTDTQLGKAARWPMDTAQFQHHLGPAVAPRVFQQIAQGPAQQSFFAAHLELRKAFCRLEFGTGTRRFFDGQAQQFNRVPA